MGHNSAAKKNIQAPAGLCVWLTGLSGAGKTTLAQALQIACQNRGRRVTLLDGDEIRQHLSRELGFSRQDRDTNVLRVGYVASQIAFHDGIVICALVSPYRQARNEVRSMFSECSFLEVYLATPLATCEKRDTKGLYKKARAGEVRNFTGIDDPYEPPLAPEVVLDTSELSVEHCVRSIVAELERRGVI